MAADQKFKNITFLFVLTTGRAPAFLKNLENDLNLSNTNLSKYKNVMKQNFKILEEKYAEDNQNKVIKILENDLQILRAEYVRIAKEINEVESEYLNY